MVVFCLFSLTKCLANSVSIEVKPVEFKDDSNTKQKEKVNEVNLLIGKWFFPHVADINITFYKNGTFVFNDYNVKMNKEEVLKGIFELNSNKLILKYYDRPQQIFKFEKEKVGETYYITKGKSYYFVKSDLEDWGTLINESDSLISK